MTSISFQKKLLLAYTWDMTWMSKINMFVHGISSSYLFELSDKCFQMSYPIDISITNIFKMFVHGISFSYLFELSDDYFQMSYTMDISITNVIRMFVHGISFPYLFDFQTNISKCLIVWISQSQIFVSGISLGYLHSIPPQRAHGPLPP